MEGSLKGDHPPKEGKGKLSTRWKDEGDGKEGVWYFLLWAGEVSVFA